MTIQEQLGILIFLTLLNCFIHPTFASAFVFLSAIALTGLIAFITKSEDKRIQEVEKELQQIREKMSSISITMGLRK